MHNPEVHQLPSALRTDLGVSPQSPIGFGNDETPFFSRKKADFNGWFAANGEVLVEAFYGGLDALSAPVNQMGSRGFEIFTKMAPALRTLGMKFEWDDYAAQHPRLNELTAVKEWIIDGKIIPRDVLGMLEELEPTTGWIREFVETIAEKWTQSMGQYFLNNFLNGIITGGAVSSCPEVALGFKLMEGFLTTPILAMTEAEAYNTVNEWRGIGNYALKRILRNVFRVNDQNALVFPC